MTDISDVPVIFSYTRAQALADCVFVDVSNTAREAGFKIPVAITAGVWEDCVEWSAEDDKRQIYQDQAGRLWDVVWMAACFAGQRTRVSQLKYQLYRVPRDGKATAARLTTLVMVVGPGDDGEPVATIMLPGEY